MLSRGKPTSIKEQKTRQTLATLAWWLDSSIRLPGGWRIGADAILGLVPFLGDALGVLLSAYIVLQAARLHAPWSVLLRMMLNVAVEGLTGLVPLAGDVFDAAWKANLRNVKLLEAYLDDPTTVTSSSRHFFGGLLLLFLLFLGLMALLSLWLAYLLWHWVLYKW